MNRFLPGLLILLSLVFAAPDIRAAEPARQSFIALAYHNVEDSEPDQSFVGITTANLIAQLGWLRSNGYQPIAIDDLLAAREGRKPLPDKAVLLTFDDGYESFYTRVFPILKAFQAPAVLALVGAWMDAKPGDAFGHAGKTADLAQLAGDLVQFGDLKVKRDNFLTWDQVREMQKSGLVEIASHSYDAHRGVVGNPQGNSEPYMTTARFDPTTGSYDSEDAQRLALEADSARMAGRIRSETGQPPRVMVWPYGEHSGMAISIAAAAGMPITFTLKNGLGTLDNLDAVPRHLISPNPDLGEFVSQLRGLSEAPPVRVVHVDLDYVYDPDPAQQAINIDRLVQRIHDMQINTVFLQAFADPAGTGLVREVYFPNRLLPMRADLFNRVAWQLRTRAKVRVFAWMPVLAYDFGAAVNAVLAWSGTEAPARDPKAYLRVSPFDAEARRKVLMLYEDLARHAPFEGLLFHDDAVLSDFEDASPPALEAYARAGLPSSIERIRADPEAMRRWTRFKTDILLDFTVELATAARRYRAPLMTARSLFAMPVLDPASEEWYAQDLGRFLATYDYAAVMAMPLMENIPAQDGDAWLTRLVAKVAHRPQGLSRTIFELQAVDWNAPSGSANKVSAETLGRQMRLLSRLGALNFGYYPDDFISGHPNMSVVHKSFSLQSYPYRK